MSTCRVYWGTHGCDRPRGHRFHHVCRSCTPWWLVLVPRRIRRRFGFVGMYPYYGIATTFYGEDVAA